MYNPFQDRDFGVFVESTIFKIFDIIVYITAN